MKYIQVEQNTYIPDITIKSIYGHLNPDGKNVTHLVTIYGEHFMIDIDVKEVMKILDKQDK